ncbi:hypothetical protein DL95DRAFT_526187 [Leptodontidium sp. 2 PMI_412]|nr:hypothetical protein DL95DRAFT_526187 [Leptodontidium sp. 2 PMI_412]
MRFVLAYVTSLKDQVRELESRGLNDAAAGGHLVRVPIVPPTEPRRTSSSQAPLPSSPAAFLQPPRRGNFMPRGSQPPSSPSGQAFSPGKRSLPVSGHSRGSREQRSYSYDSITGPRNDNGDDEIPSFLGASSAVGFMKEVYGVFEGDRQDASVVSHDTPGSTDTLLPATSSWFDDRSADGDVQHAMHDLLLPPRRTADELLHFYFNVVHPEMPVFYKPSFLQRYERLWTGSPPPPDGQERAFGTERKVTTSDVLFHCMLDIIFALGHVVRSLKTRTSSGSAQQTFIKRANRMLTLDLIGKPSLQLVHTLILMARYYQHQGLSNRNWIIVGMLIRIAQGTFFNTSTGSEAGDQALKTFGPILELDSLLQNYCDDLPPYLKPNQPQNLEADRFFARQASWLEIRILQIRITIFRRAIVRLATSPLSRNQTSLTSLQRHFTMGCIDGCASASRELIDLIHENVIKSHKPDFVLPAWYTTLSMYTTGTVLVVILRAPPLRNMLTAEKQRELQDSWGTCIENLEHYHRSGIAVAAKCIATLRKIYDEGELERQQHSGNELNNPRHTNASANVPTGTDNVSDQTNANQSLAENRSWDPTEAEIPEFWWASSDMEWLDNLADFGQPTGEGNAPNTLGALYG